MEEILQRLVKGALRRGALYADARGVRGYRAQHLTVKNGQAESLTWSREDGVGLRVLREGGWGFAGTTCLTPSGLGEVVRQANSLARAVGRVRKNPVPQTPEPSGPQDGSYETSLREDPFGVETAEKLSLLKEAESRLHGTPEIKVGRAHMNCRTFEKLFLSSEGWSYRIKLTFVGAGLEATAIGQGEVQRRSYPTSFGGDFAQSGFEFIRQMDLLGHSAEVGRTARDLLSAPSAPRGTLPVVLGSDQLALQVHESVGHATELDRVLGYEAGFAGTSFLKVKDRGQLRYGSPEMEIVADATIPGSIGSFPWDDEGVPSRRYPLVQEGLLVGFLTSRETAARIGDPRSGATMRADGPLRTPLIRMTNINLEPGDHSPEELLEEARDGLYMETNRSWSIDDRRLNFQFGCEVGRRIIKGELGPLVRNPLYSGMTPEFWSRLVARGDPTTWHLWGLPNCGKGQPGQTMDVGHGAPWGLFRDVQVGGPA